jgi:hypothetical protein
VSFHWSEYNDTSGSNREEGPQERLKRWERNISGFMMDLCSQVEEVDGHLSSIAGSLASIADLSTHLGPSDKGNILERAYAIAMLQERNEIREHLEELMVGMGTIPEVIEFMAQRPELKKFYDKVVTGTLPETE